MASQAQFPVAQHDWKLNHHVTASMLRTSPAKNNPGTILLSIVFGFTSSVCIQPAVTNSSHGLRAIKVIGNPLPSNFAICFLCSRDTLLIIVVQSILNSSRNNSTQRFVNSYHRIVENCFFASILAFSSSCCPHQCSLRSANGTKFTVCVSCDEIGIYGICEE